MLAIALDAGAMDQAAAIYIRSEGFLPGEKELMLSEMLSAWTVSFSALGSCILCQENQLKCTHSLETFGHGPLLDPHMQTGPLPEE